MRRVTGYFIYQTDNKKVMVPYIKHYDGAEKMRGKLEAAYPKNGMSIGRIVQDDETKKETKEY